MLATAGLTYVYSRAHTEWPRELALIVAVVVALVPSLVFLTTSTLMSDAAFLAVQLATLVALERGGSRTGTVVAGVGAAVGMLMRTVGVAVPLAAIVSLCLKREWRRAALFTAVVVRVAGPVAALRLSPFVQCRDAGRRRGAPLVPSAVLAAVGGRCQGRHRDAWRSAAPHRTEHGRRGHPRRRRAGRAVTPAWRAPERPGTARGWQLRHAGADGKRRGDHGPVGRVVSVDGRRVDAGCAAPTLAGRDRRAAVAGGDRRPGRSGRSDSSCRSRRSCWSTWSTACAR